MKIIFFCLSKVYFLLINSLFISNKYSNIKNRDKTSVFLFYSNDDIHT